VSSITVVEPGQLTTVQDLVGRPSYGRYGVPESGPLDRLAATAANLLVGNPFESALLEATLAGPVLRFEDAAVVALTGAELPLMLDGRAAPSGRTLSVAAGSTLAIGQRRAGARAYLAVAGGIETSPVLGSRATDVRTGLGGRPLRAGDGLVIGRAEGEPAARQLAEALPLDGPVRLLPGPHLDLLRPNMLERLCATEWRVDARSDRQGCRLEGPPLEGAEVDTLGIPPGAIQLPPDGLPIVLLADRQPTGGYPVIGVVIDADLRIVGQRIPGDPLRFVAADAAGALAARSEAARLLAAIGPADDDPSSWAGALE
jgi:biotin-dependent carboxylase-like uncharacterized protein